jgi:CxxC-x17-CxxC domain-containing protein
MRNMRAPSIALAISRRSCSLSGFMESSLPRPAPPMIKKVRTPHGTRVLRRIVCASCKAEDRVEFVPRDASKALCRKCAYEQLGVQDPTVESLRGFPAVCTRCGVDHRAPFQPEADKPCLCNDCFRGIEVDRKKRARRAVVLENGVIEVRRDAAGRR